jgi:F420-dependent oxidoreductase-like protein
MIRFGLHIEPDYGYDYQTIREMALEAERVGFDSIWLSDHFFIERTHTEKSALECWTTLTALAFETKEIHLGPNVTCVSFRHPALLARIAASLDVISRGRIEFGIGAGWNQDEHTAFGVPFEKPSTRIQKLAEALEIIKRLWTQETVDFQGRHYRLDGAFCAPKPFQKPHPPVWVGGKGDKLLRVTAQFADYTNFDFQMRLEDCRERLEILENHCMNIGRNYDEIRKALPIYVFISKDPERFDDIFRTGAMWRGFTLEQYKTLVQSPILGTPEECVQQMYPWIDLGMRYFIIYFPNGPELEPLRLFGEHVIPEIRKAM